MIDKIKIGDRDYSVVEDARLLLDEERVGEIRYRDTRIRICPQLEKQVKYQVLLHEIVHGGLAFMGEGNKHNDEGAVDRIAGMICMLIRDNPVFIKELLSVYEGVGNNEIQTALPRQI